MTKYKNYCTCGLSTNEDHCKVREGLLALQAKGEDVERELESHYAFREHYEFQNSNSKNVPFVQKKRKSRAK